MTTTVRRGEGAFGTGSLTVVSNTSTSGSGRRIRGLDAEQRRQQRRDALLDAALDLFASQGYPSTSIEQLCQHAYVGTKAFYETFSSREECYTALLSRISDDAFAQLATILEEHADEDEQVLAERLLSRFAHAFLDDDRFAVVSFGSGSAITPEADRQRRGTRRQAATFIEQLWRQGGDEIGSDHHGVAVGIVGGLFDILADHMFDPPAEPDVEALVVRLTNFYSVTRRGMRAR
jgi:AcrR family transcriptional regulator